MKTRLGHRKRIRHDDAAGEARELTFSCYRRLQRLRLVSRCELFAEAIDRTINMQHYELMARVIIRLLVLARSELLVSLCHACGEHTLVRD